MSDPVDPNEAPNEAHPSAAEAPNDAYAPAAEAPLPEHPADATKKKLLARIETLCETVEDPQKIARIWLTLEVPDMVDSVLGRVVSPQAMGSFVQQAVRMGMPTMNEPWQGMPPGVKDDIDKGRFNVSIGGYLQEVPAIPPALGVEPPETEYHVTINMVDGYSMAQMLSENDLDEDLDLTNGELRAILTAALKSLDEEEAEPPIL